MPLQLPSMPNFNIQAPPLDPIAQQTKQATLSQMLNANALKQKLAPLDVQEAQGRVQGQQTTNAMDALKLKTAQAENEYWSHPDKYSVDPEDATGDHNKMAGMLGLDSNDPVSGMMRGMMKAGVPGPVALHYGQSSVEFRKTATQASQESQKLLDDAWSHVQKLAAPIMAEKDPGQKAKLLEEARPGLAKWASFDPSLQSIIPQLTASNFDAFANRVGAQKEAHEYLETQAKAAAATPEGAAKKAGAEAKARLDVESSPEAVALAGKKANIEATARQQAAQGDPKTAGKMLADGSLTLSDLKTRGTTPQFIEQATAEAQKIKPEYNPADEMIAEHVAKSETANQFFGSANSLITKGGTLDQLEAQGKKIPGNKLPVLNSVEDWVKLKTGGGPLAGYAATALGVADDYGKVMGGGTASDHARDAALQLFAKAASPEQRADAIAATRNAVQSQRDSRIGNNQFLKRQYGSEVSKGAAAATTGHVIKIGDKNYTYNGSGDTTDLKNYTEVKKP